MISDDRKDGSLVEECLRQRVQVGPGSISRHSAGESRDDVVQYSRGAVRDRLDGGARAGAGVVLRTTTEGDGS